MYKLPDRYWAWQGMVINKDNASTGGCRPYPKGYLSFRLISNFYNLLMGFALTGLYPLINSQGRNFCNFWSVFLEKQ